MRIQGHGNKTVRVEANHYIAKCSCGWESEYFLPRAQGALIRYRSHLMEVRKQQEGERLNDANIQG